MNDLPGKYARALDEFGRRVHQVRENQWHEPTPCTDWDVRALVNHVTVEQLWAPHTLAGKTIREVGGRFEGDQLGDAPVTTWDEAAGAAQQAFSAEGALERTVHLSYGDSRADAYCQEMITDLVVHAWDLARAIGADERLDPQLVEEIYARAASHAEELRRSGLFDPPVSPPSEADTQAQLLSLLGRRV